MAKKFEALRSRMPPAARARAALRAQTMLVQMPTQEVKINSDDKIGTVDQADAGPAKGASGRDRGDR